MSWYKPADIGLATRRQLADLGLGARLDRRDRLGQRPAKPGAAGTAESSIGVICVICG